MRIECQHCGALIKHLHDVEQDDDTTSWCEHCIAKEHGGDAEQLLTLFRARLVAFVRTCERSIRPSPTGGALMSPDAWSDLVEAVTGDTGRDAFDNTVLVLMAPLPDEYGAAGWRDHEASGPKKSWPR
jgi:hypothetical protein